MKEKLASCHLLSSSVEQGVGVVVHDADSDACRVQHVGSLEAGYSVPRSRQLADIHVLLHGQVVQAASHAGHGADYWTVL